MSQVGHNNPPMAFDEISSRINDLFDKAKLWLDGQRVQDQGQADGVGKLLAMLRSVHKEADDLRKQEVKPLDDQKAAIQEKYAPLIADTKSVRGKTTLAMEACKAALAPWLAEQDRLKREAENKARREAEEKARAAQEALQKSQADNLEATAEAEALVSEAKSAERAAKRAERDTAKVSGLGRSVSLRTSYEPIITDLNVAVRHYWSMNKPAFEQLVLRLAVEDVRAGKREIPGFNVAEKLSVA